MTFIRRHFKLVTIGAACAIAGAGASAIATAGAVGTDTPATDTAATNTAATSSTGTASAHAAAAARARRLLARRAVQGDMVVATRNGFATVTFNRGFVQSVIGQQLTIREGTKTATYKTVTVTIPSSAKVRDNGESASLSQLTQGQRVGVVQGPKRTLVVARTPNS